MLLGDNEAVAILSECQDSTQRVNVTLLDAIFQLAIMASGNSTSLFLPVTIKWLRMLRASVPQGQQMAVYTKVQRTDDMRIAVDAVLTTLDGVVILKMKSFEAQNVTGLQSVSEFDHLSVFHFASTSFMRSIQGTNCDDDDKLLPPF